MEKVQVHNKRLNSWFVVDNGNVYFADTMIQLPNNSREADGALWYAEKCMNEIWGKMGEIDPIWGDLKLFHKYEKEWLRLRRALYGNC